MYLIRKVGLDARSRIDRVEWQNADTASNRWIGDPVVVPVIEVVNAVHRGRVGTVFLTDTGQTVAGPLVKVVVDDHGLEWIDSEPAEPGRSLYDMPRL